MKKIIIFTVAFILLTGCSSHEANNTESEVYPVVERYLENSAAGNWKNVLDILSGEALAETKANMGRVKTNEKIIKKNFKLTQICKGVAEVSADVTISCEGGFDRLGYVFGLKMIGDQWLIYKTRYGCYIHGELVSGKLPRDAEQKLREYFELTFRERRSNDREYLAGILLQESVKTKMLPADQYTTKDQDINKTRVNKTECLGITDGYAVAQVTYEFTKNSQAFKMEALVDVLEVNGTWKICKMDITQL